MASKRFPGLIADGETAAAGGKPAEPDREFDQAKKESEGAVCTGSTAEVPGQPADFRPFVGPVCSKDGKAAIVTAYINAEGEGERIVDPVKFWRDQIDDEAGGLEVKITGGAGFSADAIEVFEGINGTLLLAAVSLVIFLLIVIYRSPIFLFIPLIAVIFAETLSRSIGYGVSELGVTINGQSSSIMSILVLGAGTDYALLLVARYREELHRTADKYEAMRTALESAGPAIFASALTVIAALLCLMVAKVNGTSGLGPIAAIGIACAALSMLTLLPALLTIFGRRAFWPFVPHTAGTVPGIETISDERPSLDRRRLRRRRAGARRRRLPAGPRPDHRPAGPIHAAGPAAGGPAAAQLDLRMISGRRMPSARSSARSTAPSSPRTRSAATASRRSKTRRTASGRGSGDASPPVRSG